jgi:hypothetical protein
MASHTGVSIRGSDRNAPHSELSPRQIGDVAAFVRLRLATRGTVLGLPSAGGHGKLQRSNAESRVRCWPLQQTTRLLGERRKEPGVVLPAPCTFRLARTGTQPPQRARTFESQAFIESWPGKLKVREVLLNARDTLDDAKRGIGGYVDGYHHHPRSGLDDRTPLEVRQTWEDRQKPRPEMSTPAGSTSISTMRRCHECCCL